MLVVYGHRSATTKVVKDSDYVCTECGKSRYQISFHRQYLHLFLIPVIPIGPMRVRAFCPNCRITIDNFARAGLTIRAGTPLYLYSGIGLVLVAIVAILAGNLSTQSQKREFVDSPQLSDVYTLRTQNNGTTLYSFAKVATIETDGVAILQSHYAYPRFVSQMDPSDYFVKDHLSFWTFQTLRGMLSAGTIVAVTRGYAQSSRFGAEE